MENRISRHQMFMEMAEVAAKRSTCFRANVGAIIVQDFNIVSMGYNGPPSGEIHCQGNQCKLSTTGGCIRALHAEENALERLSVPLNNASLYCTHSPCLLCAIKIVNWRNIAKVYYRNKYRLTEGLDYLKKSGIQIYRITESGYVINEATNEIITEEESKSHHSNTGQSKPGFVRY